MFSKGIALGGLLILLLLTYFRENILLEINANMAAEEFHRSYSYWFANIVKSIPEANLNRWKWGVTMFFSVIMTFTAVFSLYAWFRSMRVLKVSSLFFGVLAVLVFLLASIGYLTNSFDDVYFVLRKILGLVQSPLPFFTLFALFYWHSEKK